MRTAIGVIGSARKKAVRNKEENTEGLGGATCVWYRRGIGGGFCFGITRLVPAFASAIANEKAVEVERQG